MIIEEEFDINEWRKTPMDYISGLRKVLDAPAQFRMDLIKTILEIRVHKTPPLLHKYYSLSDDNDLNNVKLNTLEKKQIYMAEQTELNDPFEFHSLMSKPYVVENLKTLLVNELMELQKETRKVSCFTANGENNMAMWAYYGGNHKGYCVSYDMKDEQENIELIGITGPVQYVDVQEDITAEIENQLLEILIGVLKQIIQEKNKIFLPDGDMGLFSLSFFTAYIKGSDWKHEKEFRAAIHDKRFVSAVPKEIFCGKDCEPQNIKRLIEIGYKLNVPVSQLVVDTVDQKFSLRTKRLYEPVV